MRRPDTDAFPILGIDYVEFYVGNAWQAAQFYRSLGFTPVAHRGLETGSRDAVSWAVRQGDATFVFTGAVSPDSAIAEQVRRHGDGAHDIAFTVPDAAAAHRAAVQRGATSVQQPVTTSDEFGTVTTAAIATYGDTVHSLVSRGDYHGVFLPGYRALNAPAVPGTGIRLIDHVVGNVELGRMDHWVVFYQQVMGFAEMLHFSEADISTEYSALMSKVLWDGKGTIKLPINEPAVGRRKSQIDEYLDYYQGPGVQHVALLTDDIVATVGALRQGGVPFLGVPERYYDDAVARVPEVADLAESLQRQSILVDHDDDGYLLQIFTAPLQDRPTFFLEIIERHGSQGFGAGNFKALFEAIEREQALRGNL